MSSSTGFRVGSDECLITKEQISNLRNQPIIRFRHRKLINLQKAEGFSLFELVVFIILVAIIYATAAIRFADFPGQAERANFMAITTQLQTAVNLEMMIGLGTGRIRSAEKMDGVNPMDLMLQPPSNYIGVFDLIDRERIQRRVWYFDRPRQELVYLVNDTTGVYLVSDGIEVPTDEIRFRIMVEYGEEDIRSGLPVEIAENDGSIVPPENRRTRLRGVLLRPVFPYKWGGADADTLIVEATNEFSG